MRFFVILAAVIFLAGAWPALATSLGDGNRAYEEGDYESAVKFWKRSADDGNIEAEYNLCQVYYYGDGVPSDPDGAIRWCRKSAEKDDVASQVFLAETYENSHGVKKDEAQAATWYERAANEGNLISQARLGAIYSEGIGVKKDIVQAYKWLRLAQDANEKYYGWSSVVNEMTHKGKTAGEDIERDLAQLSKAMAPEQKQEAEVLVDNWESAFKANHPVKRKFSPLLFFFVFLCPALAMSSVPGRQQRFYYGIRMATWAIISVLLFLPWFLAWSRGENLQNAPETWMRAFVWTGIVMLAIFYLMKRCSSEAVTFFDGLMFSINSFGESRGVHVLIACPLFIIIILGSLAVSLFNELIGRPSRTATQYYRLISFLHKHRHNRND